jgi:hypothetical protein
MHPTLQHSQEESATLKDTRIEHAGIAGGQLSQQGFLRRRCTLNKGALESMRLTLDSAHGSCSRRDFAPMFRLKTSDETGFAHTSHLLVQTRAMGADLASSTAVPPKVTKKVSRNVKQSLGAEQRGSISPCANHRRRNLFLKTHPVSVD